MKIIEKALKPVDGYVSTFKRNTQEGCWELEVGLPKGWVYDENDKIGCETIIDNDLGVLIRVYPKDSEDIVIDDLVSFVKIIITTNKKIAEKEKEFTERMSEMRGVLENEAKKFYTELDELKENSFKSITDKYNGDSDDITTPKKTRTIKPKTTKKSNTNQSKKSDDTLLEFDEIEKVDNTED